MFNHVSAKPVAWSPAKRLPSSSPRNHPGDDATRHLDGEVVKPRLEKPRRGAFQPPIFAPSHSFDERDALVDNGELSSFTDLLSCARLVAAQVALQMIHFTIDSDNAS